MNAVGMSDALSAISGRIAAIQAQLQSVNPSALASSTGASAAVRSTPGTPAPGTPAAATATAASTKASGTFAAALDSAVQDSATSASAAPPTGADVVADAKKYLGVPYVWGGTSTSGLDCSGLVQLTFKDLGVSLPRVARDQAQAGSAVPSLADARPGDLVAFGAPVDHIAIYLGDNQILEAPQPGQRVHITEMYRTPTAIRRIVPAGDGSPVDAAAALPQTTANIPTSALGIPPGLMKRWDSAQLADVPRAVPLAALGLSAAPGIYPSAAASADTPAVVPAATSAIATAGTGGLSARQLTAGGLSSAVAAYAGDFAAAETKFNLPTGLLAAVAQAESAGNATAVSPAGAQGLMQLMPGTAAGLGVTDPFDPQQSIDAAGKLFARNLSAFGGSLRDALAAYNAGAGAVQKYGGVPPYAETQRYVRTITDTLARLS